MASIEVGQRCAGFQRIAPICGNCKHEICVRDNEKNRTERSCGKHGWFVLFSSTCKDYEYRLRGNHDVTATDKKL